MKRRQHQFETRCWIIPQLRRTNGVDNKACICTPRRVRFWLSIHTILSDHKRSLAADPNMLLFKLVAILTPLSFASSMAIQRLDGRSDCLSIVGTPCDPNSFVSFCCDNNNSIQCVNGVQLHEKCINQSVCVNDNSGAICRDLPFRQDLGCDR